MRENRRAVRRRVGRNVTILRLARGLSQERLAEMVDTGGKYIGQIERGEVNVTLDTLMAIAAAVSVHVTELFGPPPAAASGTRPHVFSERDYQTLHQGAQQLLRVVKKANYPGPRRS